MRLPPSNLCPLLLFSLLLLLHKDSGPTTRAYLDIVHKYVPQNFGKWFEPVMASTRRYSPLRGLTCSSCGGFGRGFGLRRRLWQRLFLPFEKKELSTLLLLILFDFRCSVVTSVMLRSNLVVTLKIIQKISITQTEIQKHQKSKKILKINKKIKKNLQI